MATANLTADVLRARLIYEPDTGHFYHRVGHRAGNTAGSRMCTGYIKTSVNGKAYTVHRLAFLYMSGAWPTAEVDHINGDRSDNRWRNLRLADRKQNAMNLRDVMCSKSSGLPLGVFYGTLRTSPRPYVSKIRVNGRSMHLGCFSTIEAARDAYITAKRAHHSTCTI